MLKFMEQKLSEFRSCFSRTATYNRFLIILTGLIIRFYSLGATSFICALSLEHRFYETMLHFFRSNAFITNELKIRRHKINRKLSSRKTENDKLKSLIQKIFIDSKNRYACTKIMRILHKNGFPKISLGRVSRLMKQLNIRSIVIRKFKF